MTTAELERQKVLADELLSTMEKIKAIWDELPNLEQLQEMLEKAAGLADDLVSAKDTWRDEYFPTHDAIAELSDDAERLATNFKSALEAAREIPEAAE